MGEKDKPVPYRDLGEPVDQVLAAKQSVALMSGGGLQTFKIFRGEGLLTFVRNVGDGKMKWDPPKVVIFGYVITVGNSTRAILRNNRDDVPLIYRNITVPKAKQ